MTYEDCINNYGTSNGDYCSRYPHQAMSPFDVIGSFFNGLFSNILLWILLVIVIILVAKSIKIIRQQTVGIVERLGRYQRSQEPGIHLIIPFIERVVERVDMMRFQLEVETKIKTKDEQVVTLPVAVFVQVIDPKSSLYEVDEPDEGIKVLVSNEVKAKAAQMTLQEIFDDRDAIRETVHEHVNSKVGDWGFTIKEVAIDNPQLTKEMENAYNSVAVAERAKQAATADGDAYKIRRDRIAEGNASALKKVMGETGLSAADAMRFLVSVDTNSAVRDAATSGATVVVATANAEGATLGMMAQAK